MCNKNHLRFKFSKNDLVTVTVPVNTSSTNSISHSFVNCPIYNPKNKQIGYKVSDDYVQQVAMDKYVVRLNNTYTFTKNGNAIGTISWQYVFINTANNIYYPIDVPCASQIISGTGIFEHAKGKVTLLAKKNGDRLVDIEFEER
uniref:Uncharacterized protein n=1 Tax=viral metagenome TaxID=1070528 RepID=A0A6C0LF14_9ZZZZ